MDIPKSFKTELTKRKSREEREKSEELKKEKRYQQDLQKYQENEEYNHQAKIEICKKIFAWKEEFLKTKDGARIFKRSDNNLWIFTGNWGHKVPQYGGYGCWSRIYLNFKDIEYWAGYKWMGGGPRFNFAKSEEMAKKLDHKYLRELLMEIENKNIFKSILQLNDD